MFSRISPVKQSDPEFSFVSRFLIIDWSSLHRIDLFKFSISSCFIHGKLYVSGNLFISSRLSRFLLYNSSYSSVMIPHITVVLVVMSPFPFLILSIWICQSSLSQRAQHVMSMQGSWPWGGVCVGEACGMGHAGGVWGPLGDIWGKLSPGPCERAVRRKSVTCAVGSASLSCPLRVLSASLSIILYCLQSCLWGFSTLLVWEGSGPLW